MLLSGTLPVDYGAHVACMNHEILRHNEKGIIQCCYCYDEENRDSYPVINVHRFDFGLVESIPVDLNSVYDDKMLDELMKEHLT